jgi:hypothetical protein
MATLRQIEANRLNAQKSTGPRSVEGKAASRFNAVRYGIDARSLLLPGEDPAELEALAQDYRDRFRPNGPLENYLVDALIQSDWQKRRYLRAEAQLLGTAMLDPEIPVECPLGAVYAQDTTEGVRRILRRLDSAERSYFRALQELRRREPARPSHDPAPAQHRDSSPQTRDVPPQSRDREGAEPPPAPNTPAKGGNWVRSIKSPGPVTVPKP